MIDVSRAEWAGGLEVSLERKGSDPPITILTGNLDQAALQGLLRRLFSHGLPLISVVLVQADSGEEETQGGSKEV
jgi:hypothetical protein